VLASIGAGFGFDVPLTLKRFFSGRCYYNVAGNGLMRLHADEDFGLFFDPSGRIAHLLYLKSGLTPQLSMTFGKSVDPHLEPKIEDVEKLMVFSALRVHVKGDLDPTQASKVSAEIRSLHKAAKELALRCHAGVPRSLQIQLSHCFLVVQPEPAGQVLAAALSTKDTRVERVLRNLNRMFVEHSFD
jgi:hypothetical protein